VSAARPKKYGLSTNLSVNDIENEQAMVLGGVSQNQQTWSHVLTRRAAQVLWFKLTQLLYPDKASMVTGLAVTASLRAPRITEPLTTHVDVVKNSPSQYTLVGWVQRNSSWMVLLDEIDARRLWAALDVALYPVGWEGRETKPNKLN